MKLRIVLCTLILLAGIASTSFCAEVSSSAGSDFSSEQISVSDYCHFLNAVAAADPHILYDEEMEVLMERHGEQGDYCYEVLPDQEKNALIGMSCMEAMRYCNWKENGRTQYSEGTEHGTYELAGDQLLFINPEASCRLLESSRVDTALHSNRNGWSVINNSSFGGLMAKSDADNSSLTKTAKWIEFFALVGGGAYGCYRIHKYGRGRNGIQLNEVSSSAGSNEFHWREEALLHKKYETSLEEVESALSCFSSDSEEKISAMEKLREAQNNYAMMKAASEAGRSDSKKNYEEQLCKLLQELHKSRTVVAALENLRNRNEG